MSTRELTKNSTADGEIDCTEPKGQWVFDREVARAFDDMLYRSIPQYNVMRSAVTDLAIRYYQPGTRIVDLGCSRGEAIAPLVDILKDARFTGVEISEPMREAATARFSEKPQVEILPLDLRTDYPEAEASVTLSVLTLQFTPIEYRQAILRKVFARTLPGGAFILVEKILGDTAELNETFVKLYYDLKAQNGYSQEQIERKRLSLEGVLVPVSASWNKELLQNAGFRHVDCFWRWMNFAGWIALKSD